MLEHLESQVFSRIKYGFPENVKKNYPDLNFTTSDQNTGESKFPTVYVHLMGSPENSQDLERTRINGVSATFQIDVSDNVNQSRARAVMNEILKIMKGMMFDTTMMPYMQNYNGVFRCIARFHRNIDYNDIL